jgi:squalene synthase HpnC
MGTPPLDVLMAKSRRENFPVAPAFLPARIREPLLSIYGFARLVDDAGDEAPGDRAELLDDLELDLGRVFGGAPQHPAMRRLVPTVRRFRIPPEPFRRLIEANRQDQVVSSYERFQDLRSYCELSANPVGHLVLYVLEAATPDRVLMSDDVCTALQLVEHWQDVAEDARRGRVYLPQEDLRRFEVAEPDLAAPHPTPGFRRLMAFEVERAYGLLDRGAPLVGTFGGRSRALLAGFVSGGRSALEAIEAASYDVLGASPRPTRWMKARAFALAVARGR